MHTFDISFKPVEFFKSFEKRLGFKNELKWWSVLNIMGFHIFGVYWCYHHTFPVKWQTVTFAYLMFLVSGTGITCGVHRLWTHRSFKVSQGLKIFMMLSFSAAGQNSIYDWVRDHRLHHKYSDTEADPHNSKRGLIFSHIGWLMMKKNDLVREKGREINMTDIESDPLLMWERRHSTKLSLIFCYLLPTITCIVLWGETVKCAVAWQCFIRVLAVLHSEMTVNSLAHAFGPRPYNKNIIPRQNIAVSTFTLGEGCHNYHHVFPYDYKSAETFDFLNFSTFMIRLYKRMGLVYDLKEPTKELVESVTARLRKEYENEEKL